MSRPHQIARFILEMEIPDQETAQAKQDVAADIFKKEIARSLERVLDKFDKPGQIIKIDRLELDLSEISFEAIDTAFTKALEEKLDATFAKLLQDKKIAGGFHYEYMNDQQVSVHVKDAAVNEIELVIFYLRNGFLPWEAQGNENFSVEKIVNGLLEKNAPILTNNLLAELKNKTVRMRLARQFSPPVIRKIISLLFPDAKSVQIFNTVLADAGAFQTEKIILHILEFASQNFQETKTTEYIEKVFFLFKKENKNTVKEIFRLFPSENELYTNVIVGVAAAEILSAEEKNIIFQERMQSHPLLKDEVQIRVLVESKGISAKRSSEEKEKKFSGKETDDVASDKEKKNSRNKTTEENKEEENQSSENESKEILSDKEKKNPQEKTPEKNNKKITDDEKEAEALLQKIKEELFSSSDLIEELFINNAGLVIVQPFLVPFFKELKLTEGKEFVSAKEQSKAVYLLHHIATGNTEKTEEHELVLEKMLCGLEMTEVLEAFEPFTETEISESNNLLTVLIEHWSALKKSSPTGLRETFIKRQGRLKREASGWTLRIERVAFDVLLDKLPWGISIVKAPWNKEMLYVEW